MTAPHNQADVRAWLEKARDDLRFATASADSPFYSHVCFISQQASEKALKGLIYSLQEDFLPKEIKLLRTHRLKDLVAFVKKHNVDVDDDIREACGVLDRYYLPTRYPDVPDPIGTYTEDIARDALEKARAIVRYVEGALFLE